MIPGTLYYFHLYFIDLAKTKQFDDLTEDEKSLYSKFEKKFNNTREFQEVEIAFQVVRKLEKLPSKIDEKTSNEQVEAFLDVMDFIDT